MKSNGHGAPHPLSARRARFANVDAAVEIRELIFRTAAVDGPVDGLVDLDQVLSTMTASIFNGLLGCGSLNLDVEIGEDLTAIGLHAEIGFQIGRKVTSMSPFKELKAMGF